jgi:hypothetical protein
MESNNINSNENINKKNYQEIRESNMNIIDNNIQFSSISNIQNIPSLEKFLFLFEIEKPANQFCCGCTINTGIKIISFFFISVSFSCFLEIFLNFSFFNFFANVIIFLTYFSVGYNLIYSLIYNSENHAYYAYVVYCILFLLNCLDSFVVLLFVLTGYLNFLETKKRIINFILLSLVIAIFTSIHLYILYICYSYWRHLKNRDFDLLKGKQNPNEDIIENNLERNLQQNN